MSQRPQLKDLVKKIGVKEVAYYLHVSTNLVYGWLNDDASFNPHKRSPVERMDEIINLAINKGFRAEAISVVNSFCQRLGGSFIQTEKLSEIEKLLNEVKNGSR